VVYIACTYGIDHVYFIAGCEVISFVTDYGRALFAKGKYRDLGAQCTDAAQIFFVLVGICAGIFAEYCIVVKFGTDENIDLGQHRMDGIRISVAVKCDHTACLMDQVCQTVRYFIGAFQMQDVVCLYKVFIDIFHRIFAAGGGTPQNVAAFGHRVGQYYGESVSAIADHVRGVDVVIVEILNEKVTEGVCADDTDHRGYAA